MALRLGITVQHAQIALSVAKVEVAERVYAHMVAAEIWTIAESKNRILTDLVSTLETVSASLGKSLTDQTGVEDLVALLVSTLVSDAATLADSPVLSVVLGPTDTASLIEVMAFEIHTALADSIAVQESHAIAVVKGTFTDTAVSFDDFALTAQFQRIFLDTLSLDDISNVDKNWDATKQNVALTGDAHYWATSKVISDAASVGDLATIAAQKLLSESATVSDAIIVAQHFIRMYADSVVLTDVAIIGNDAGQFQTDSSTTSDIAQWALGRLVSDTASILEEAHLSVAKAAGDSAQVSDTLLRSAQFHRTFADTIALDEISNVDKNWDATKQNAASINDTSQFNLGLTYSDSALVQEAYQYTANKALTESIGISEVFIIQIAGGSIPVFNGVTFNSGTFG